MGNVFLNPTYKSDIGFNDFPMRQHKQFSGTVGQILPVYYDYLKPGDKVSCACDVKTRFEPMVAPAFMNVVEHVDWFFVPISQIYKPFGDLFYGIQDLKSDFFDKTKFTSGLPSFSGQTLAQFFLDSINIGATGSTNTIDAENSARLRFLDHIGVSVRGILGYMAGDNWASHDPTKYSLANVPVWLSGTYQKIWSDIYRLSDWQENDAWLYNFDSYLNTPSISYDRFKSSISPHLAPLQRDFNTFVYPSPVFGSSDYNAFGAPMEQINQWLTGLRGVVTGSPGDGARAGSLDADSSDPTSVRIPAPIGAYQSDTHRGTLNPPNIRTLFAAEKFLEITRRAGKHYDKQTLAHYGINVPTGLDGEVFFLGGMSQPVGVQDVFATAETEGTPLGQLAGKAFGNIRKGGIRFEAKCEGFLMAVYYALPDVVYPQLGYDPLNRLVRVSDFFNPQLDSLGPQPNFNLYRSLISNWYKNESVEDLSDTSSEGWNDPTAFNSWQWRYMELKAKQNIAFGSFIGSRSSWTVLKSPIHDGYWYNYVCPSTALNDVMVVKYSDSVPQSYSGTKFTTGHDANRIYNGIYDRDPLLHDCMFYVNKVSKMSTYGLPSL